MGYSEYLPATIKALQWTLNSIDKGTGERMRDGWLAAHENRWPETMQAFMGIKGIDPALEWCRHQIGCPGGGETGSPDFDETSVPGMWAARMLTPKPYATPEFEPDYTLDSLVRNIETFVEGLAPGYHAQNIPRPLPHVQVISTGRCGTVGLHRLLEMSDQVKSRHAFWWYTSNVDAWEMCARFISGVFEGSEEVVGRWMATRAAEWLGPRPTVFCSHRDTIYAPVMAALHPEMRFVFLVRNFGDTANSFLVKRQNILAQLRPLAFSFDPFTVWIADRGDPLRWYYDFTSDFAAAMGRVFDLVETFEAEKLWAGDRDEISRLLEWVGVDDIPINVALKHFEVPINQKLHKL